MDNRKITAAIAIYAVCGWLTYGYVYNHRIKYAHEVPEAAISGMLWPLYWAGRGITKVGDLAIWITKGSE